MRLYKRSSSLIFGPPGAGGIKISGLRVVFRVTKTASSEPNMAQIQVYNLGETSRNAMKEKGAAVILYAGYDGIEEIIFRGSLTTAVHNRTGADRISMIECGDGASAIEGSRVSKSFNPGSTVRQVIDSVAASLSPTVIVGEVKGALSSQYPNGFSASGYTKDVLDRIATRLEAAWSIQDGDLTILPHAEASGEEAVLLTPQTGLIGSPAKKEDGRIEVKSLLMPKIRPGRLVSIISEEFNGFFKALRVTHSGDTHGQEWSTTTEAVEL